MSNFCKAGGVAHVKLWTHSAWDTLHGRKTSQEVFFQINFRKRIEYCVAFERRLICSQELHFRFIWKDLRKILAGVRDLISDEQIGIIGSNDENEDDQEDIQVNYEQFTRMMLGAKLWQGRSLMKEK